MLVDDSQKEVSLLKEGLKAAGYDVVEVTTLTTSAAALLDRVAAMRPDVIIIDTDSPTRDTLEQLSFVSAQQPRPIVLFTEERDNATIQAALKAGVSAYVVAGMQPDRLQPILDVAVARFEQERELRDELQVRAQAIGRAQGDRAREGHPDEAERHRRGRGVSADAQARDGSQSQARSTSRNRSSTSRDLLETSRDALRYARLVRPGVMHCTCEWCDAACRRTSLRDRTELSMNNIDESIIYRLALLVAWISLKRKRS